MVATHGDVGSFWSPIIDQYMGQAALDLGVSLDLTIAYGDHVGRQAMNEALVGLARNGASLGALPQCQHAALPHY